MGRAVIDTLTADFARQAEVAARISSQDTIDDFANVDVIVDFSLPDGTDRLIGWLQNRGERAPVLVSGTTGLADDVLDRLRKLGESTKVLHSNNFSAGVAALTSILEFAVPVLEELGYTPVLTEAHHEHKRDAPSGTAKSLCETLQPDAPDSIQVHSIRAGEVIGKHDVRFYGAHDEIVIGHEAKHRGLFAQGAVDAALWLCRQPEPCGSYTMQSYFRKRYLD